MTEARRLKLDLITGYLLTAARVIAWAVIFGILYRNNLTYDAAGIYAYCRGLIAFVPVLMLNIPQALFWRLSVPTGAASVLPGKPAASVNPQKVLEYATPRHLEPLHLTLEQQIHWAAIASGNVAAATVLIAVTIIAFYFTPYPGDMIPSEYRFIGPLMVALCIAAVVRCISDTLGIILHRRKQLWLDNLLLIAFELLPVLVALLWNNPVTIAGATGVAAFSLLIARSAIAKLPQIDFPSLHNRNMVQECTDLMRYGATISLSQAADLLYAPLTLVLVGAMSKRTELATYSTLIQFDAALLLLTAAITTTLTPRVSNLLSANDPRTALKHTFKATGISLAILVAAALTLYLTADPILKLWLGDTPPQLLTVLPIFLIHTVIGGASAPLRAVLLLAGKAKQLTIANTLGGLAVATATFLILKYPTHTTQSTCLLPLQAIAAATALSVTLRCALWMPWYTHRVLSRR